MQSSNKPTPFPIPWANSAAGGYVTNIPQASQIGVVPGAASLTDGFPPLNFQSDTAGGVPPRGVDFNGILKEITQGVQWLQAGGITTFNSTFATAIGGYPKGALVADNIYNGYGVWLNITENNVTAPTTVLGTGGWYYIPMAVLITFSGWLQLTRTQWIKRTAYSLITDGTALPNGTIVSLGNGSGSSWAVEVGLYLDLANTQATINFSSDSGMSNLIGEQLTFGAANAHVYLTHKITIPQASIGGTVYARLTLNPSGNYVAKGLITGYTNSPTYPATIAIPAS